MKIIRITTLYEVYIREFYRSYPELVNRNYAEQLQAIHYDAFAWADSWQHALHDYGYDVTEIIANIKPLQTKWAQEAGVNYRSKHWLYDIVLTQIKYIKPEILFIDDFTLFDASTIQTIRENVPSIRKIISWCGAPYGNIQIFKAYDSVFSNIPEIVTCLNESGMPGFHINHCFDPRFLQRVKKPEIQGIEFSFIGQINYSSQGHKDRKVLLEYLRNNSPIEIFSPIVNIPIKTELKILVAGWIYDLIKIYKKTGLRTEFLESIPKVNKIIHLNKRPAKSNILEFAINRYIRGIKPGVFGLNMYRLLQSSKLTLNSHINISGNSASNMRLYEATGVGTCLVTDWKENLPSIFEPDKEVVTYCSAEECVEKVMWLLDHPLEREEIAKAGQKRTLARHTFTQRAEQFDNILKELLADE